MYYVFHRKWWKDNKSWPNGLEPHATAKKFRIGYADTEEQARAMCKAYNNKNKPGRYSDRAEYDHC